MGHPTVTSGTLSPSTISILVLILVTWTTLSSGTDQKNLSLHSSEKAVRQHGKRVLSQATHPDNRQDSSPPIRLQAILKDQSLHFPTVVRQHGKLPLSQSKQPNDSQGLSPTIRFEGNSDKSRTNQPTILQSRSSFNHPKLDIFLPTRNQKTPLGSAILFDGNLFNNNRKTDRFKHSSELSAVPSRSNSASSIHSDSFDRFSKISSHSYNRSGANRVRLRETASQSDSISSGPLTRTKRSIRVWRVTNSTMQSDSILTGNERSRLIDPVRTSNGSHTGNEPSPIILTEGKVESVLGEFELDSAVEDDIVVNSSSSGDGVRVQVSRLLDDLICHIGNMTLVELKHLCDAVLDIRNCGDLMICGNGYLCERQDRNCSKGWGVEWKGEGEDGVEEKEGGGGVRCGGGGGGELERRGSREGEEQGKGGRGEEGGRGQMGKGINFGQVVIDKAAWGGKGQNAYEDFDREVGGRDDLDYNPDGTGSRYDADDVDEYDNYYDDDDNNDNDDDEGDNVDEFSHFSQYALPREVYNSRKRRPDILHTVRGRNGLLERRVLQMGGNSRVDGNPPHGPFPVRMKREIFSTSTPNDLPIIELGVMVPVYQNRPFEFRKIAPAIYLAIEKVDRSILTTVRVRANFVDSQCSISDAMNVAINLYAGGLAHAFLGPVCDYAVAPVARQIRYWQMPLVTPGALAGDFGFNKPMMFPFLTRLGTNFNSLLDFFLHVMQHFNWVKVKMLYHPDGFKSVMERYCHIATDSIVHGLLRRHDNVTVDHKSFHSVPEVLEGIKTEVGHSWGGE